LPPSEKPPLLSIAADGSRAVVAAIDESIRRSDVHKQDAPGWIYVRQSPMSPNEIKIGWENKPYAALRALNRAHSVSLKTLVLFPGTKREERTLHARFQRLNLRSDGGVEHFAYVPEMRTWVSELIARHGAARRPDKNEQCLSWLARVGTCEAQHNIDAWWQFRSTINSEDCPRTWEGGGGFGLWQICAGYKHGHWAAAPVIGMERELIAVQQWFYVCRGVRFYVFKEACDRSRKPVPQHAIVCGVIPVSHPRRGHDKGAAVRRAQKQRDEARRAAELGHVAPDEPLFASKDWWR